MTTIDTTTTTTKPTTRTITLTDRPPVKITDDTWPVIAHGTGKSSVCYHTPIPDYQVDSYDLRVRQHADGRTIVYGILNAASAWTGTEDCRGGVILTPPGDGPLTADDGRVVAGEVVVNAIRRIGTLCGFPDAVIRDCIADLPADEI